MTCREDRSKGVHPLGAGEKKKVDGRRSKPGGGFLGHAGNLQRRRWPLICPAAAKAAEPIIVAIDRDPEARDVLGKHPPPEFVGAEPPFTECRHTPFRGGLRWFDLQKDQTRLPRFPCSRT